MKQAEIAALLGRPLTPIEVSNFKLYIDIAKERLSDLICTSFEEVTEDRVFDIRADYRTVMLDVFTEINSVVHDGTTITEYTPFQWSKRNGDWFNSIVLDECLEGTLTINADWGFCYPPDIKLLLAKLFSLVGQMNNSTGNVKSKEVEDFKITFSGATDYDQFVSDNQATIDKYSLCREVTVTNGRVSDLHQYFL